MSELFIHENITDWMHETLRDESIIESDQDIIHALAKGGSTAKVARAAIVSREMGKAPSDIVRPNKMLLNVGAQMDITQMMHNEKTIVKTSSGEHPVSSYIGIVKEKEQPGDEDAPEEEEQPKKYEPSFVSIDSAEALERSIGYLERVVPGHIWNRLLVVHEAGGDVRNEADKVKQIIDDMVSRIV